MQALGVTVEAAQHILHQAKAHGPTFIAQGSVKQLVAERPSLPVQWPKLIHRFPLLQNTYAVSTAGAANCSAAAAVLLAGGGRGCC